MKLIYLVGLLLSTHSVSGGGGGVENKNWYMFNQILLRIGPFSQIQQGKAVEHVVSSKQCTRASKLDLQLIVDSSESIGEKSFHKMRAVKI